MKYLVNVWIVGRKVFIFKGRVPSRVNSWHFSEYRSFGHAYLKYNKQVLIEKLSKSMIALIGNSIVKYLRIIKCLCNTSLYNLMQVPLQNSKAKSWIGDRITSLILLGSRFSPTPNRWGLETCYLIRSHHSKLQLCHAEEECRLGENLSKW